MAAAILPHRYAVLRLDEMHPHPANPNVGDEAAIAESIEAAGFYGVVLVHEATGNILAGEHRWKAAAQTGLAELPAIVIDCDEDTARRIMVGDNQYARLGVWDHAKLVELLTSFQGLHATGFGAADLARLLPPRHADTPDAAEPRTQPGDLWLLGDHRVLCGDATDPAVLARLMDGERARLMVTDPPYLTAYDGTGHVEAGRNKAMRGEWDEGDPAALYPAFLAAVMPHLDPAAYVYQWHSEAHRDQTEAAWRGAGLRVHQVLHWIKTPPVLTHLHFAGAAEPCLYGWREGSVRGDGLRGRTPRSRRPPMGTPAVWHVERRQINDLHPTEKPVRVFRDPMTWHLREGEIAVDPFGGSGSAVAAAEEVGRRCFTLDREPAYVDTICLRWQRMTGREPVLAATGEAFDFEPSHQRVVARGT